MSNTKSPSTAPPLVANPTRLHRPPSLKALNASDLKDKTVQELVYYNPEAHTLQTSNRLVSLDEMRVRHLSADKIGNLVVKDEHNNTQVTRAPFVKSGGVAYLEKRQRIAFEIPGLGFCIPSDRFWQSWGQLFKLHHSVFNYFGYGEAFRRVQLVKDSKVQLTLEKWPANQAGIAGRLLAVVSEGKPLVHPSAVKRLFGQHNAKETSYQHGVLSAQAPCPYPIPYDLGDIKLVSSMHIEVPLDGYGKPAVYLAFDINDVDFEDVEYDVNDPLTWTPRTHNLTCVCRNKAFRTEFQTTGSQTNSYSVLNKALDSFANEEGFVSLKTQFELAGNSWASMDEFKKLESLIRKAVKADIGSTLSVLRAPPLIDDLMAVANEPYRVHGHSNVLEMSARRARTTPAPVTVLKLILFASKLTTKVLISQQARKMMSDWIGNTLLDELDMPESKIVFPQFSSYFIQTSFDEEFVKAAKTEDIKAKISVDDFGEDEAEEEAEAEEAPAK